MPVVAITGPRPVINNFSFPELAAAKRQHDFWSKVVYALESGDETTLPSLPVPFKQFFLSEEKVLCRYWPNKKEPVAQYVIPECYVPAVLHQVHDSVIAGHPGRERTLTAARESYFWPTIQTDVEAQHKGTVPRPDPILEYPPPNRP